MILTLRTDKPDAEIGLYDGSRQLAYVTWPAHRQLAETIHKTIDTVLVGQGNNLHDITGIIAFQGPGSFTGLRIGLTVANALAYSLQCPIVAMQDPNWVEAGIKRLMTGETDGQALPFYGADVHITPQKK